MRSTLFTASILLVATCPIAAQKQTAIHWNPLDEPGSGGAMTAVSISPHDGKRVLVSGDMLGVGLSTDRGDSWQPTEGFRSWEIADSTWHPTNSNVVWVGTMSGPYVSLDGGRHWQERRKGMPRIEGGGYSAPVEKVLFDPHDASHLLAFGGSSRRWNSEHRDWRWGVIWESRDGGAFWNRLSTIMETGSSADPNAQGRNVVAAAYAPGSSSRLFALVDNLGFYASEDGGKTWEKRNTGLPGFNVQRMAVSPKVPGQVWISLGPFKKAPNDVNFTPGGIFTSSDSGKTWHSLSTGLPSNSGKEAVFTSGFGGLAVSPSNPAVMYTSDMAWNGGGIYGSIDGGAHWRLLVSRRNQDPPVFNGLQAPYPVETAYFAGLSMSYLAIDPNDPNVAFAVNTEYILRTLNGGKTWNDATAKQVGAAWAGRGYSGLCCTNFRFNPREDDDALLLGMDAGKLWRSQDGLKTWTFHGEDSSPWGGGDDATYAGTGANTHIYATFGQFGEFLGIGRTTDNGKTWKTLGSADHGLPAIHDRLEPGGIYALPAAPDQVWTVIGGNLYHSTDAGDKWTVTARNLGLRWIAADPAHPDLFYISGKQNIYRVDAKTGTMTAIGGPRPAGRGRMTVDSLGRLYACQWREGRGGLWRYTPSSDPAAGRWERLLDDPFIFAVAVDPTSPNRIAITTNDDPYHDYSSATGVWVSADGGKSWSQQNDGLAMLRGQVIAFNPHHPEQIIFGSFGRGFFVGEWPRSFDPAGQKSYTSTAEDTSTAAVDPGQP